METNPPTYQHLFNTSQAKLKENPPVLIKDLETKQISGSFSLITRGRGFACISTGSELKWVPAKNIKPYLQRKESPASLAAPDPKEGGKEEDRPGPRKPGRIKIT